MSLDLFLNITNGGRKMDKTKMVGKNAYMRLS